MANVIDVTSQFNAVNIKVSIYFLFYKTFKNQKTIVTPRGWREISRLVPGRSHCLTYASDKFNIYTVYYLVVLTSLLKRRKGTCMCTSVAVIGTVPMLRPGTVWPRAEIVSTTRDSRRPVQIMTCGCPLSVHSYIYINVYFGTIYIYEEVY